MTKTLVDTNILIYAHRKKDGKMHDICAELINGLIDRDELVLSIQNLVEFSRVLTEKTFPSLDKDVVRQYVFDLSKSSKIISYNDHIVMDALLISKEYKIHFFDALLAATMQESGINDLLTQNTNDFGKIPWLTTTNPFTK